MYKNIKEDFPLFYSPFYFFLVTEPAIVKYRSQNEGASVNDLKEGKLLFDEKADIKNKV